MACTPSLSRWATNPDIELNRTDPYARVQQLLLTGDQIYSDDVAAAELW